MPILTIFNMDYQTLADKYLRGSGDYYEDRNPASLDQVLAKFRLSTPEDVVGVIENAKKGFHVWSSVTPPKRGPVLMKAGELMENIAQEMALLLTLEEGKTLADSLAEVLRSANLFKFYGALAFKNGGITLPSADSSTRIITVKEPLGIVAAITPWNFPLAIPAWKTAPALAAGNSVVLKPASKTPLIVLMMLDALVQAGLPEGVLNVVVGPGGRVGDAITASEDVAALSFTGSTATGEHIYRMLGDKKRMTRLQLELGGKNAIYVDRTADLALAADLVVKSAFGLTGQSCTAASRVIVNREIEEPFRVRLIERVKRWKVGPGTAQDVNMGPLADESQYKKTLDYNESGRLEGAKLIYSAESGIKEKGYFVGPSIFEQVTKDMRIFQEEIFGPVLSLTTSESDDEAIDLVNGVVYGHTAGIVSKDHYTINRFIDSVEAGVIKVNKPTVGLELQAPFGGFKRSGATTWKEMGEEALEFYSREKTVYLGY
jgi:2,5-dioxopentanoate dehydrogenase